MRKTTQQPQRPRRQSVVSPTWWRLDVQIRLTLLTYLARPVVKAFLFLADGTEAAKLTVFRKGKQKKTRLIAYALIEAAMA